MCGLFVCQIYCLFDCGLLYISFFSRKKIMFFLFFHSCSLLFLSFRNSRFIITLILVLFKPRNVCKCFCLSVRLPSSVYQAWLSEDKDGKIRLESDKPTDRSDNCMTSYTGLDLGLFADSLSPRDPITYPSELDNSTRRILKPWSCNSSIIPRIILTSTL